ncbi:divalent-cation tolerance protein CutA [Thermopetrobacter sp. TC1]|uniref:divalent-cation tolerance protein CutA n=1 Tax=Thermopetrobacter sp. TC1 TaxID=1495045 RepID=UPI000571C7A8|nr:divalent-cation tolerance protein CutA [Thermopetrobacter sp. TC1]
MSSAAKGPAEERASLIYTTLPDEEAARTLGEALVKARLAACVNIIPGMRSIYEWKGRLEHDEEVVMIVKTMPDRAGECMAEIALLHPYEEPAIIRLPATDVSASFLDWLHTQTRPGR